MALKLTECRLSEEAVVRKLFSAPLFSFLLLYTGTLLFYLTVFLFFKGVILAILLNIYPMYRLFLEWLQLICDELIFAVPRVEP